MKKNDPSKELQHNITKGQQAKPKRNKDMP